MQKGDCSKGYAIGRFVHEEKSQEGVIGKKENLAICKVSKIALEKRDALDDAMIKDLLKDRCPGDVMVKVGDQLREISLEDFEKWIFECKRESDVLGLELAKVLKANRLRLLGIKDFYGEYWRARPSWLWENAGCSGVDEDEDYCEDDSDEDSDSQEDLDEEDNFEVNVVVEATGLDTLEGRMVTRTAAKAGGHSFLELDFGKELYQV